MWLCPEADKSNPHLQTLFVSDISTHHCIFMMWCLVKQKTRFSGVVLN